MSIQRRSDELVDLLRPDFVGNDGTASPSFVWVCAGDGTAAAPGFRFCADPDTGFYRRGANEIGIATQGVARGYWDLSLNIITYANGEGLTITSAADAFLDLIMDSSRDGGSEGISNIRSLWAGTEVSRIEFRSGTDNVNKDDGEIKFYTRFSGLALAEAGRIDTSQDWYRSDDDAHWSQVSDQRFKRDIVPVTEALDSLRLLEPIRFRYAAKYHEVNPASDLERVRTGFTAENFAKVFPEQVKEVNGYKSMNTSGLNALLVAAVQELHAEREAMRAEIAGLRKRLAVLEPA